MKHSILLALFLLSFNSFAAPSSLSKCRLEVATTNGASVEVVPFDRPTTNFMTGATERVATWNSTFKVVLIEAGKIKAINFIDSEKEIFVASDFNKQAMFATKENTMQVTCK